MAPRSRSRRTTLRRLIRPQAITGSNRFCNFRRAGHGSEQLPYNPRYATRGRLHVSSLQSNYRVSKAVTSSLSRITFLELL
jgi:hypothetical protein